MDLRTNELNKVILQMVEEKRSVIAIIRRGQRKWLVQSEGISLPRIEERMDEKNKSKTENDVIVLYDEGLGLPEVEGERLAMWRMATLDVLTHLG